MKNNLIVRPGQGLAKISAKTDIATRMAEGLLQNAGKNSKTIHYRRVGDFEFKELDYEQLQRWARRLKITLEELVDGLASSRCKYDDFSEIEIVFEVKHGSLRSLVWDFERFPLSNWEWVDGLALETLAICGFKEKRLHDLPTSLNVLYCKKSNLTSLDLSSLSNLKELYCQENQLIELDLSPVPNLQELDCSENQLTELDLNPVPNLQKLKCWGNQLTKLDLSPVPNLQELDCRGNQLTKLDLSPVPNLQELDCRGNQLTELDLNPVPNLQELLCWDNQLTELDLSPVPNLQELYCSGNQLTELDLNPVPNLQELDCWDNQLTELDLSPVPNLQWLSCDLNVRLINAPAGLKVNSYW